MAVFQVARSGRQFPADLVGAAHLIGVQQILAARHDDRNGLAGFGFAALGEFRNLWGKHMIGNLRPGQ